MVVYGSRGTPAASLRQWHTCEWSRADTPLAWISTLLYTRIRTRTSSAFGSRCRMPPPRPCLTSGRCGVCRVLPAKSQSRRFCPGLNVQGAWGRFEIRVLWPIHVEFRKCRDTASSLTANGSRPHRDTIFEHAYLPRCGVRALCARLSDPAGPRAMR